MADRDEQQRRHRHGDRETREKEHPGRSRRESSGWDVPPALQQASKATQAPESEKPAWQRSFFTVVDCTRGQVYDRTEEAAANSHLFVRRKNEKSCFRWKIRQEILFATRQHSCPRG